MKWYFTFGVGHPFARFYWVGEGTYDGAREAMVERFGTGFSSQYDEAEGRRIAEKYGLSELIIGAAPVAAQRGIYATAL